MNGIDLNIYEGEKIAVLGSNGAGKSTFFLNINGVLKSHHGEIYYRGEKITKKNLNNLDVYKRQVAEYGTTYPKNGWAEQSDYEWFEALKKAIPECIKKAGIAADNIAAITCDATTNTLDVYKRQNLNCSLNSSIVLAPR